MEGKIIGTYILFYNDPTGYGNYHFDGDDDNLSKMSVHVVYTYTIVFNKGYCLIVSVVLFKDFRRYLLFDRYLF